MQDFTASASTDSFGLAWGPDRQRARNEHRRRDCRRHGRHRCTGTLPWVQSCLHPPPTRRCILSRIFLYVSSHFCPPYHPPTPPSVRSRVKSQEREPDPLHITNRAVSPAFLSLTACWDVDTHCCTCFHSDRKQISLASFKQSVSQRKYYLQIKHYAEKVWSPNISKLLLIYIIRSLYSIFLISSSSIFSWKKPLFKMYMVHHKLPISIEHLPSKEVIQEISSDIQEFVVTLCPPFGKIRNKFTTFQSTGMPSFIFRFTL